MTPAPMVALVGNPNAGKSALFNALTGARQKVGNYPGVTVERKSGRLALDDGRPIELVDLPGTYSLDPASPDEAVTRDVLFGAQAGERRPSALVVVLDATNLDNHLRFALQLVALGLPTVIALNMIDMARRDGLDIDLARLSAELGVPVVPTVAVRKTGLDELRAALGRAVGGGGRLALAAPPADDLTALQRRARRIADAVTTQTRATNLWTQRFDRVALHPVAGPILLAVLMFVMFQAVFSWSQAPIDALAGLQAWLGNQAVAHLPDGFLRSLLVEGVINGVGSVVAFLPQILILFAFILVLEASGYMVRAAFLMDRLMAGVGLSGRAFIPLLSSFACAIPGIMATRSIDDPRDRLTTILIAPMMTCSARLPVYAVIIGAFIPARQVVPGVGLQGLVLFGLYLAGIAGAMLVALVFRRTIARGGGGGFMMELPKYQMPVWRDVAIGLWQRAFVFLRRAGTTIMAVTLTLWLLTSYPQVPAGSPMKQSEYSIAGRIASGLEPIVRPIGFNHALSLAIIPAMAAREVAVSALQTVYSIDAGDDEKQGQERLTERLRGAWSLPTALAFLAWFVFAPQCLSTIAVIRRETNGWAWPAFTLAYLFGLAWIAAGITFWTATALGL
ncbi:ferrous iron transporter B [Sphingomonas nostoxanthinifaciens]|uniref:ferrous iron transporter B n=1 Tax=Sphingomonas nostoxanthinifaciens TaxID=2872652 RepID=UPI001CC1EBC0|nr:ferrous iron transporter B [Sphingomonas nostoxanthinifaciens]UAK25019.1 ferrous iron transporter B [Sphingomonas nostoxanthinifaciens]